MRRLHAGVAAALITAIVTATVTAESPVGLTVRLYNSSGIASSELLTAKQVAEPIFRATGMDVVFRHCGAAVPEAVVDACDDVLKPSEVVVRVIDAPPFNLALDPLAFGVTYVIDETGRGWLATVFSDRIAAAASRVDIDSGTLLGRVLAHEAGHLLLGNGYHGDAGVMRAQWTDALLHHTDDDWRFSRGEAALMQQRLQNAALSR